MAPAQSWSTQQDLVVFRKIVADTLAARSQHYSNPPLAPWAGHGGDRINKKIQQMLKKFGSQLPGGTDVINEELAKVSKAKPKVKTDRSPSTTPKKRKRVVKSESEDEDFDDYRDSHNTKERHARTADFTECSRMLLRRVTILEASYLPYLSVIVVKEHHRILTTGVCTADTYTGRQSCPFLSALLSLSHCADRNRANNNMTAKQTWSTAEDIALFRAMVASILAARHSIYTTPELAPWSGN